MLILFIDQQGRHIMNKIQSTFLIAAVLAIPSAKAAGLPDFSKYPVSKQQEFSGSPEKVDLKSHKDGEKFKTKLTEGAAKGPNYAGELTIVEIGCGTQCQDNWVVDAKSGKIVDRFSSMIGTKHQVDSTLLIVNPPDPQLAEGYKQHPDAPFWKEIETSYEVWTGDKFETLHKDKWVNIIKTTD